MRLHSVRLRNYRGVTDSTVDFSADGVTVIQGDNEVGKTCIPEALDLILGALDSSHAKQVRDVRPVHRDEGPEVEVDISSGDYRFVYSKRWHRLPRTVLDVSAPRREQLTGREAHDRVEAILAGTLDADLWRALRIEQGAEVTLPLFDVPSLGRALDRAAGGELTGSREDDLWDRICAERERYWTATGQVPADRKSAGSALDEARVAAAALEARLDEIAREVAEVDRRLADEERLLAARDKSEREEGELRERWDLLEQRRRDVESLAATYRAAVAQRDRIDGERQRRAEQVQALADRSDDLAALEAEAAQAAPALAAIIAHCAKADADLAEARAALRVAQAGQRRANEDRDHHRRQIEVEQLAERHERVVVAQAALAAAEAHLASARVDGDLVERIEKAHIDVVRAEAAAGSAAASLEVTALSAVAVRIDGDEVVLDAGATSSTAVTDEVEVVVPDVVRLRVRAGSESVDSAAELTRAREEFDRLCEQGGVADLAGARRSAEAQRDAGRNRTAAIRTVDQDLRDLTVDVLVKKIEGLSQRIASYAADRSTHPLPDDRSTHPLPDDRPSSPPRPADRSTTLPADCPVPPLPADFDAAKRIASEADRVVEESETVHTRCQAVTEEAAGRRREAELDEAGLGGKINIARTSRDHAAGELVRAREERPDAALRAALAAAQEEADEARGLLEQAEAALRAADPDSLEVLLRNAAETVRRAANELESNQGRLQELRISLLLRGEEGLHAQYDDALSHYRHLEAVHERTESRARAVQLLHDTFAAHRQQARRRYVAPFKERVEKFGRIVFGSTFEIELDDDLRVVRRTLDGITLDIDQLSVGAREQIGVLSRLACAVIVSPDGGGAPVVLDDALGWSDPSRLARMGAAIATAGRECQVIVLTCTPGRYSHVGNAKVVNLPA